MNRHATVHRRLRVAVGTSLLTLLSVQAGEMISSPEVLEQKLKELDAELHQLAHYTLRTGVGNLGWLSDDHSTPDHSEWIHIQLKQETTVDQIVLAPILWMDAESGPVADGFPVELRILAGADQDPEGAVIATYRESETTTPRVAPLVISLSPTKVSWVRIEATQLSPWAWDEGTYIFQLAEVLIFSGNKNVALHCPVTTSSKRKNWVARAMSAEALVDGFMPYRMDAATGERSDPYLAFFRIGTVPSLRIDLGREYAIDGINLHAADLRENIPRIHHADYGVPKHLVIEGSLTPDFSNATLLADSRREQIYDAGPIIMLDVPAINARYVRFTAREGYQAPEAGKNWRCMGFAEIEICSHGGNIATGRNAILNIEAKPTQGTLSALTDGLNHYGHILPLREWVNQLARRHELAAERPRIETALTHSYLRQSRHVRRLQGLASALAAGIALAVLIEYLVHRRKVRRLTERFAADLHVEIGANLHTIGLLSDMVEEHKETPEDISPYLQRIRAVTERTGTAIRHVTKLHESRDLFSDLKTDMQRAAERIVTRQQHTLTIHGEDFLPYLNHRTRIDLFLFFKECLINISRHSGATALKTELTLTSKEILLSVSDNGIGLPRNARDHLPKSLKRRAKLFRAHIQMGTPDEGGTRITLKVRNRVRQPHFLNPQQS